MIGMLWYDANPETTLEDKVLRAKDYYNRKYGFCNVCHVSAKSLSEIKEIHGLKIVPDKYMMVNNFWIGDSNNEKERITRNFE